jgi:hypothetical protein
MDSCQSVLIGGPKVYRPEAYLQCRALARGGARSALRDAISPSSKASAASKRL